MPVFTVLQPFKNVAYNFSDAQVKVREATSDVPPWDASTTMMSEISDLTHNPKAFNDIMSMIWKRLHYPGKSWRFVYKSLVLLDFLIKCGNEKVVQRCRESIFTLEMLEDFPHVENNRYDQSLSVREKAKQITSLLSDDVQLKKERLEKTAEMRKSNDVGVVNSGKLTKSALDDLLSLGVGELVTTSSDPSSSAAPIRQKVKKYYFSDAQVKVREATSNIPPWEASRELMSEIADLTYNSMELPEIMSIIWKRLNDSGKNWRHVYKSLVLLDFLIKCGNEKVAQQCRENVFTIETLKDFQHVEDNRDQGLSVREKAKQIISLFSDDDLIEKERDENADELQKACVARNELAFNRSKKKELTQFALDDLLSLGLGELVTTSEPTTSSTTTNINGLRKTPENFLGETSGLVNLGNLPGTSSSATAGGNPFLSSTSAATTTTNPFAAQQRKSPTLNEMRAAQGQAPPVPTMAPRGGLPQPVANPFANRF